MPPSGGREGKLTKSNRLLGIGKVKRGQQDQIAHLSHAVDIEFFPGIGRPVIIVVDAGKEMKHGNFFPIKRHVVASADVVRFPDLSPSWAALADTKPLKSVLERVPNTVKRFSRKRPTMSRLSIAFVAFVSGLRSAKAREPYRPSSSAEKATNTIVRAGLGRQAAHPARQIEQHGGSRSVVVGARMNLSFGARSSGAEMALAEMIVVRADDDIFLCQRGVGAGKNADDIFRPLAILPQTHLQAHDAVGNGLRGRFLVRVDFLLQRSKGDAVRAKPFFHDLALYLGGDQAIAAAP